MRAQPETLGRGVLNAPRLRSVATAVPGWRVDQENAKEFCATMFGDALGPESRRLFAVFDHSGIESRRVCMPLDWYGQPHGFGETNALYVQHALALATEVARGALDRAGLAPRDVDHVVFVSSTGLSTPSIDARLANVLGLRSDVRRTPIWGLGCAGGAAGLSRARDFALADPDARVLLIALELCSLTFQPGDLDRRNLVACSLFSDGAAAAVIGGARAAEAPDRGAASNGGSDAWPSLEIVATQSTIWPDTLDVMGWDVDEGGLHVVFSRDIPSIVRERVRENVEGFLSAQGLALSDVDHWVAHPGGPRVLDAYAETLAVPAETFRHARAVLSTCGNMSSPTCLFVLERAFAARDFHEGDRVLVTARGPGFSSEDVLMRGGT